MPRSPVGIRKAGHDAQPPFFALCMVCALGPLQDLAKVQIGQDKGLCRPQPIAPPYAPDLQGLGVLRGVLPGCGFHYVPPSVTQLIKRYRA